MHWFTNWYAGNPRKAQQPRQSFSFRPRVGTLEERCVPAAIAGPVAMGQTAVVRNAVITNPGLKTNTSNGALALAAIDLRTAATASEPIPFVAVSELNTTRLAWYDTQHGKIDDITVNNHNAVVPADEDSGWEETEDNDQLPQIVPDKVPTPAPPPTISPALVATPVVTVTSLIAGPGSHQDQTSVPATLNLTITVTPASGDDVPDGSVALLCGSKILGTKQITVNNGVASASIDVALPLRESFSFSELSRIQLL